MTTETPGIEVTDSAAEKLREVLDEQNKSAGMLRIMVMPSSGSGGCGSGGGGFLGQMLSSIPADKTLPPDLKAKLDSITSGGDRSQIRTVMQELRAWANSQGIELSSGGDRGGG